MQQNYALRAIQMDLARQMEPIPFIRDFIDFIAENHYNTLVLYLEWRIRTKTFDIGETEGYSSEDLRNIIEYATAHGITVIPGLATFGHAELLLQRKEFASYSELREGRPGRDGGSVCMDFCPSQKTVRTFLEAYLRDVADIFRETPFFHVGGDEVRNIAMCSTCRKKADGFLGEERLYRDHMIFIHQILKNLGKRMMMWDDMFEFYPDILPDMPRDIIMVNWIYLQNVRNFTGHFCNLMVDDWLARYDQLGFEYLIAPADFCWSNTRTFTAYADAYHPLGALLTSWEKTTTLLYKFYPVMAAAGQLWHQKEQPRQDTMDLAVRHVTGMDDDCVSHALAEYADLARNTPDVNLSTLTAFSFFGPDNHQYNALQTLTSVLRQHAGKVRQPRARLILKDILLDCRLKLLECRSKIACWQALNGQQHESLKQLADLVQDAGHDYAEFLKENRQDMTSPRLEQQQTTWRQALLDIESGVTGKLLLTIRFVLPDGYGAQKVRISVNGCTLAERVFKLGNEALFEYTFFLPEDTRVENVTLDSWGFGGQGIAYVFARQGSIRFVPEGIVSIRGVVHNPGALLQDTMNYAYFGTHDIAACYRNRSLATSVHSVTLKMKRDD